MKSPCLWLKMRSLAFCLCWRTLWIDPYYRQFFLQRGKISEVIPLPKDGDHEIPNNNRPVSLLPAASKICERVALNQLMTYMTTKRRLSEDQSGNKKLHSCKTLNVVITDKALETVDAKKVTLVVLLDLSKAFDSIDHVTLLAKLQALGASRASLDWFKS